VSQIIEQPLQRELFGADAPAFDSRFSTLERTNLDDACWIDYAPDWLSGSDQLFDELLRTRDWKQRTRWMYEREVLEPRLTAFWIAENDLPLSPRLLNEMRLCLSKKYGVLFDSLGFNLYRNGQDAVAWHGDKIRKEIAEPVVALISLGERRRLLLRPKEGGSSRAYFLGRGDLFVTGGKTQRIWQHSVPRVVKAGPRMSLAFRHGMNARAYDVR
jgi:alkylated DNA repair dioxygenase AlkB